MNDRCLPLTACLLTTAALLLTGAAWSAEAASAVTFHVAPDGTDDSSGDTASTPVRTLGRAQALAREYIAAMAVGKSARVPVRVLLAPGRYLLDGTLAFSAQDSGTKAAPVSYEAQQPGSVQISGGLDLGNNMANRAGDRLAYTAAAAPTAGLGGGQLFVNGRRAVLARQPNEDGDWFVQSPVNTGGEPAGRQGSEAFRAAPQDLRWINSLGAADAQRAVVNVYQSWSTGKHRLSTLPWPVRSVRITPRTLWPFLSMGGSSQRYFVENVVAALDSPGEWIQDGDAVRYIARPDEVGKPLQATLPRLERLVVVQGEPGKPVSHLHFVGLSFAHTRYLTPDAGAIDNQAAYIVGAAIEVNHANGFVFDRCSVEQTGGWGLWLREGVRNARVSGSTFSDLGAGGIKVGLAAQPAGDTTATGANELVDNTISLTGRVFPGAVGIFVGQSWDNRLLRNTVHDTTYTGISVGWTWGYGAPTSGRNLVKGNLLYNIGQREMADLGGIYTLGRSPGTVITGNIIRNVRGYTGYGAGAWGIYNDEGSSSILVQGNVVVDTDSGGYHLHFGRDNVVEGNIFAGGDAAEIHVTKAEPNTNLTVRGNLLAPSGRRLILQGSPGAPLNLERNEVVGRGVDLATCGSGCAASTASLQAGAPPTALRSAAPRWMAVIHAALAAWDGTDAEAALRADADGAVPAPRPLAEVKAAPKARTAPTRDLVVDLGGPERPLTLQYAPKEPAGAIQVQRQPGAPGGHCLVFNDGPAFAQRWEPFATAALNHAQGSTTVSFDLQVDLATAMVVEWRDAASPYLAGPSLRITAAGAEVGGKVVAPVAVGKWTRFRMSAPLATDGARWTLEVEPAGGHRVSLPKLAVKHREWKQLARLVFSSDAVVESRPCLAGLQVRNSETPSEP